MLAEHSPFMDDESRQSMSDAQDRGPGLLKDLIDPGFQAMHDDPSPFNAAMLGLGTLGPAGKGAGKVIKFAQAKLKKMEDTVLDIGREYHTNVNTFFKDTQPLIDEANRLGISPNLLEPEARGLFLESLPELVKSNSWTSRLTPARYENKALELVEQMEAHRNTFDRTTAGSRLRLNKDIEHASHEELRQLISSIRNKRRALQDDAFLSGRMYDRGNLDAVSAYDQALSFLQDIIETK